MANRATIRTLLATFALSVACLEQTAPAQKAPSTPCHPPDQAASKSSAQKSTDKPCPESPDKQDTPKPSVSEQFPFPGAPGKPLESPDAPVPNNPDAPRPNTPHPSAATEHPFPAQPAPPLTDGESSSRSSSDNPDATPDPVGPPLHDEGSEGKSTRRKLPKVEKVQSDDERVDEDLTVARFYAGRGNFNGAYLRAKDAVKVQPDYSEAHFTLAEVAQKLRKKEEAIEEYKAYLKLDPNGEKARAAQRALNELQ